MTNKILIITPVHTHPTDMGNSSWIMSQVETLKSLGCDIYLLYTYTVQKRGNNAENLIKMREYWGDHLFELEASKAERICRNQLYKIRARFCKYRQGLYDSYPWKLTKRVKLLHEQYYFDACIVNYVYLTKLFDTVKFPKMVCSTHDTFAYKNLRVSSPVMWLDAAQEAEALQKCTDVFSLQDCEMHYFQNLSPKSRHYNCYNRYEYIPQPVVNNHHIVFLSGRNEYNQRGLQWFLDFIWPLIKEVYPDAILDIAGGICKALAGKYSNVAGLYLHGFIDNVSDFYKIGDVAINPTREGTGLKIKTFEAIAHDKVTIVHPHSMNGIFKGYTAPIFASEEPEEWVEFLKSIWNYPEKISETKNRNRKYIEEMNSFVVEEYTNFLRI